MNQIRGKLSCRIADDDPRSGPASLQKFTGEDLQALSSQKLRKEEDAAFWEAQAHFKATEVAKQAAAEKAERLKVNRLANIFMLCITSMLRFPPESTILVKSQTRREFR